MVKVKNDERGQTYNFIKAGSAKDGRVETVSVGPGETVDLEVDENDPVFKAAVSFGTLTVVSGK
jgi:hypothetical protein